MLSCAARCVAFQTRSRYFHAHACRSFAVHDATRLRSMMVNELIVLVLLLLLEKPLFLFMMVIVMTWLLYSLVYLDFLRVLRIGDMLFVLIRCWTVIVPTVASSS